jgi:RNA polymerase sigma-70 factor (sigma-E family)
MVSLEMASRAEPGAGGLADLYRRHAPAARSLAYLLTGDRGQAEDLAQEAFVRLAGRFRHLRNPDAFPAYLRRTVVNLHTSQLRRRRLERAWLEREGREPVGSNEPDVAAREDLWHQLLALPPRQRAALVLRYYEDLSEAETAEVLRCSVAAAKSLTQRAMESLRGRMEAMER